MKSFFTYFFLAGGMAFSMAFAITFTIHLVWAPFLMENVIFDSIGCGLGVGIGNGILAARASRR